MLARSPSNEHDKGSKPPRYRHMQICTGKTKSKSEKGLFFLLQMMRICILESRPWCRRLCVRSQPRNKRRGDRTLGSLRIVDFCSTTPLDFVTCLLRMPIRELSSVTPKSTTWQWQQFAGVLKQQEVMISADSSGIYGEGFEGRASCDGILKADGATDRKSFPPRGLLWWKAQESALPNEKPNLHICKDRNSA